MLQVWFFFSILETILGTFCIYFHAAGVEDKDKEPLVHIIIYCGTFVGFTLLSFLSVIAIAVGSSPSPIIEIVNNFVATIMYFLCALISMNYAEKDFHLQFLSDFEEPNHPHFASCRKQSIAALIVTAVHLLHGIFALDVLLVPETPANTQMDEEDDDDEDLVTEERIPIKMYFLCKSLEDKLRQNEWFDHMCTRRGYPLTIYSGTLFASHRSTAVRKTADLEASEKIYKEIIKKQKAEEPLENISSEEFRSTVDYRHFASSPPPSPLESKPFEIVDEKKDSAKTRFDLSKDTPSTAGADMLPSTSGYKTILKKKPETDLTFAAVEPAPQAAKKTTEKAETEPSTPLPTSSTAAAAAAKPQVEDSAKIAEQPQLPQQPESTISSQESRVSPPRPVAIIMPSVKSLESSVATSAKDESVYELKKPKRRRFRPTPPLAPVSPPASVVSSSTESEGKRVVVDSIEQTSQARPSAQPATTKKISPRSSSSSKQSSGKPENLKEDKTPIEKQQTSSEVKESSTKPKETVTLRKSSTSVSSIQTLKEEERPSTSQYISTPKTQEPEGLGAQGQKSKEVTIIKQATQDESTDYLSADSSFVHDESDEKDKKNKKNKKHKK